MATALAKLDDIAKRRSSGRACPKGFICFIRGEIVLIASLIESMPDPATHFGLTNVGGGDPKCRIGHRPAKSSGVRVVADITPHPSGPEGRQPDCPSIRFSPGHDSQSRLDQFFNDGIGFFPAQQIGHRKGGVTH
jgi:hypothetical protein